MKQVLANLKNGKVRKSKSFLKTEKGHRQELEQFITYIREGKNDITESIEVTKVTLQ